MTYQITGGVVAVVKVAKKVALEVVALTVQESIRLILKFITLIIVEKKCLYAVTGPLVLQNKLSV